MNLSTEYLTATIDMVTRGLRDYREEVTRIAGDAAGDCLDDDTYLMRAEAALQLLRGELRRVDAEDRVARLHKELNEATIERDRLRDLGGVLAGASRRSGGRTP